ncbi:MAG: uroporphyrinogen decarboxylase [Candidatus Methanomethylophilaceae archaeon]|nr:uroporphyrinogen decarboxylase [Candidatus Methanomethylophilaceae archaeon]
MDTSELFPPIHKSWHDRARRRYAAAVLGGEADRVPVDPMMMSHSTLACGFTIRDYYENPCLGAHCLAYVQELYDLLPVTKYYFAHPWMSELGTKIRFMDYIPPVPDNIVVNGPEDVDKLRVPDPEEIKNGFTYKRLTMANDYIKKKLPNMFVPLAACPEPEGSAAALCGIEEFLMWTVTDMDLTLKLIRKYTDTAISGAEAIAKTYGMALVNTGAVLANSDIMPPETIKKVAAENLPYLIKESFKRGAGPQIFYHFCGNHADDYHLFVNRIIYSPLTIVNIGYKGREVFPAEIMKEAFGDKATIMPAVDTKRFISPNPKAVYDEAVRQILAGRDSEKGFILGTACEVPPYSPPGHIRALVRAAEDYGRYGTW